MAEPNLLRKLIETEELSPWVKAAHQPGIQGAGLFRVESSGVARLWGLPKTGESVATEVRVASDGDRQIWWRRFDGQNFETLQWVEGATLIEAKGPGRIAMRLSTEDGAVRYEAVRAWFGPFRTPWYPHIDAEVREADGGWSVSVEVRLWPFGVICRYSGILRPL